MKSARLELERFGAPPAGRADGPAEIPATVPSAAPPRPAGGAVAGPAPEPPCPPDPEAERRVALARIAAAVELIATEQGALRQRGIAEAASALAAAAESLLPRLARHGFAEVVAETTAEIAQRGRWPDLALHLSPTDADSVGSALGTPPTGAVPVRVVRDAALESGEAWLRWDEGGADIDLAAIAATAQEQFRLRLATCPKEYEP